MAQADIAFSNGENEEGVLHVLEATQSGAQAFVAGATIATVGQSLLKPFATAAAGDVVSAATAGGVTAAKGVGRNIALGLSGPDGSWLSQFAKSVGGETWETWGGANWRQAFKDVVSDPANKVQVNLTNVDSAWAAATRAARGAGGATDWELL